MNQEWNLSVDVWFFVARAALFISLIPINFAVIRDFLQVRRGLDTWGDFWYYNSSRIILFPLQALSLFIAVYFKLETSPKIYGAILYFLLSLYFLAEAFRTVVRNNRKHINRLN